MTETEAKWAARVERWRASGKTAPEFAQGQGFESSTLRYWASRLKHLPPSLSKPVPVPRVRMVRVRWTPPAVMAAPLVVGIGAARVEVRSGFDRALLRQVVEALAEERDA
jgi:hypothetical protein